MRIVADTSYYPSSGDDAYFVKLKRLVEKYPHDIRHYLDLFTVYANRRPFTRYLAHYELFKMTVDLPGHYLEFGVYFGKSYFIWHKLLEVFTPTATHKKVIGFDTFEGFPRLTPEDGKNDSAVQKEPGGWSAAGFHAEFLELLELHNQDAVLPAGRGMIVKGDVCKTLPQWLDQNSEARFCLCNLDMDLYEPTSVILDSCWDRIVTGGVVIFDEYATSKWPGETKAWDDFAAKRGLNIPVKRFSFANSPGGYLIKP
jgi:hypothetical protein